MGLSQVISLILEGYKLLPINAWILEYKGIKWLPSNGMYIKDHLSTFTLKYSVLYQWIKIIKWFFKKMFSFLHISQTMKVWPFAILETEHCLSQLSYHWVGDSRLIFSIQWNRKMICFLSSVFLSLSRTWCLYLLLQLNLDSWPSNKDKFLKICLISCSMLNMMTAPSTISLDTLKQQQLPPFSGLNYV